MIRLGGKRGVNDNFGARLWANCAKWDETHRIAIQCRWVTNVSPTGTGGLGGGK